jgi:hypothetical protein
VGGGAADAILAAESILSTITTPNRPSAATIAITASCDSFPLTAAASKLVFIYWENRKEEDQGEVEGGAADEQNSISLVMEPLNAIYTTVSP